MIPGEMQHLPQAAIYADLGEWGQMTGWVCAVRRRRFPVGERPTRRPLQPEAIGAVMELTKWLKPSISVPRIGGGASVHTGDGLMALYGLKGSDPKKAVASALDGAREMRAGLGNSDSRLSGFPA